MDNCIFCKIIRDHSLGTIVFENNTILGIVPFALQCMMSMNKS